MANLNCYPGETNANWQGGKFTFNCIECGKEFKDYHRKRADRKFCSIECGYENKRRRTTTKCEYCGVEFEVFIYDLNRGKGKFCSRSCFGKANSGENCFQWKGGISSENNIIRNSDEYRFWRKLVFKRDYYTCQFCGSYNEQKIEAHHVLSFMDYPEYRFDVNNGITYCKECHDTITHILKIGDIFQPLPQLNI